MPNPVVNADAHWRSFVAWWVAVYLVTSGASLVSIATHLTSVAVVRQVTSFLSTQRIRKHSYASCDHQARAPR
jgi:hypothetical protein